MSRYPELTIRIDVEHDIVSPVAENYDIVFAMLEAPLPANNIIIRPTGLANLTNTALDWGLGIGVATMF